MTWPPETYERLKKHVEQVLACRRCPNMASTPVSGGPVLSKVLLFGQAPGQKEPILKRPFAWTAGKTLFQWFEKAAGIDERQFRASIYMAAVCRCFPGKKPVGGDRVPAPDEVANCAPWLDAELDILEPELVIPVGRLAIERFLPVARLDRTVGRLFAVKIGRLRFDLIPLPHPSGASPWHRMEPGRTLLEAAMRLIADHPAFRRAVSTPPRTSPQSPYENLRQNDHRTE